MYTLLHHSTRLRNSREEWEKNHVGKVVNLRKNQTYRVCMYIILIKTQQNEEQNLEMTCRFLKLH